MDKINEEIIEAKLRLHEIEKKKKSLDEEYQLLQDKIHLYFDSPDIDTTEAERFIVSYCYENAYKQNANYAKNDRFLTSINEYNILLPKIIEEENINTSVAVELGCGTGVMCEILAKKFDQVIGLDLSPSVIKQNIEKNKFANIKYICEDARNINFNEMQGGGGGN